MQILKMKKIFCKLDTSKEHRDKEFALRQQIKKLRDEKSGVNYRIRDMQIQSRQSESGNWIVMRPTATATTPNTATAMTPHTTL